MKCRIDRDRAIPSNVIVNGHFIKCEQEGTK